QSHREAAMRALEILGITKEFDVIATREDVEHGKPAPEMHLLVARDLSDAPGDALAIEDSPAGIEAALAAGAQAIAVTTDLTRQKFLDSDVLDRSHVVDDPRVLPDLVR